MMRRLLKRKQLILCCCGALFGAAAFLLLHTAAPLDVTDDAYILRGYVERDIIQHYAGWLHYRGAPAAFPLGIAESVGFPGGGAVAFSDSVPLFAILFGFFSDILPETFQYFGLYTLCCYLLMGVAAALLLEMFLDKIPLILLGTALFAFSPVMTERAFRHTALASHFLIIFALLLYFKNRRAFRFRWGYLVLSALAVTVHFYFVPMVLALLFADLLQMALDKRKFLKPALFLLSNVAAVFAAAFVCGYFYRPTAASGQLAYGYFTMNLNALFNPVSVSGIRWSRLLPVFGQGLGSAEGFNYLGLSVLLMLFFAGGYLLLRLRGGELKGIAARHRALLFVFLLLSVFAVSTTVVANNTAFVRLELPLSLLRLLSTFRSSGRLFWPVYYALMLFAVVFFCKKMPGKWRAPLLFAAVAAQLLDLSGAIAAKRAVFLNPAEGFSDPTQNAVFQANRNAFREVFTVSEDGVYLGLYIARYAAENGMVTNEPFMARNDIGSYRAKGTAEYERLLQGEIDPDKMYIFGDVNRFFNAAAALGDLAGCGIAEGEYYVILPKAGAGVIPEGAENFVALEDIPFTVADYTDGSWTDGVLNDDRSVVTFYDNAFTKPYLEEASFLICGGRRIEILEKDYRDEGWVMVRLALADASVLAGQPLSAE